VRGVPHSGARRDPVEGRAVLRTGCIGRQTDAAEPG